MIDHARLEELRAEIGEEDLAEVVASFMAEADEVMDRMLVRGPGADISADLHFLRGAALNLGLRALAELCRREEEAAPGRTDTAALDRLWRRSKAELLLAMAPGRAA